MLVDEPVAQPARVAAGKRPRHNGFGELRILQRGAVHGAASRFVGEQKRRAELRGDRACRQDPRDIVCGHQPAGGRDRHVDGRHHRRPAVRPAVGWPAARRGRRCRGARPPTGPAPRARRRRGPRAVCASATRCHGADDGDAGVAQPPAFLGAGHAECERRDVRPQIEQHVDLGRPVVVVEARLAERGAVALAPRSRAPWRTARCPRACPHSAAAQRDSRRSDRTSGRALRRVARRTRRRSGNPPERTRVRRRWSLRPPVQASTAHPPSARR